MRRRDFITWLGGAAGASTYADLFAAQTSRIARIGILGLFPIPLEEIDPFKTGLHALGWREDENLQIEERYADGDPAGLPRLAAELVALRPDVLIAPSTQETKALQTATSDIPIVFTTSADPVRLAIVDSIAHPGRNATGISIAPQILWGKRLELIAELIGHPLAKIAWMGDPGNAAAELNLADVMRSAEQMRFKLERLEVREPADLDRDFMAMDGSDALLVQFDWLTYNRRQQIAELAIRHRLPAIYDNRLFVVAGGLISYGADVRDNWRRGATYVYRILKGARPRDLPVEQASRFELVINLKTAKTLGLAVAPSLLARADEVIE
jgi:putative tryptophan/tyrosine transport system substrate-binding protein